MDWAPPHRVLPKTQRTAFRSNHSLEGRTDIARTSIFFSLAMQNTHHSVTRSRQTRWMCKSQTIHLLLAPPQNPRALNGELQLGGGMPDSSGNKLTVPGTKSIISHGQTLQNDYVAQRDRVLAQCRPRMVRRPPRRQFKMRTDTRNSTSRG